MQGRSWVRTHGTQLRLAIPSQSRSFIGVSNLRLHLEASWFIQHIGDSESGEFNTQGWLRHAAAEVVRKYPINAQSAGTI